MTEPRQAVWGRTDRWVAAGLALAVVAGIVWLWTAPVVKLTFRSTDDAYYYYNVVRNILQGHGSTFDGINPTNGYHPLWIVCLLPVFALVGGALEPGLRAALSLGALFAGLTGWLAYRTTARAAGRAAGFMALVALGFPVYFNPLLNGLESGLLVLLLFSLLAAAQRWDLLAPEVGGWRNVLLGALLGVLFLIRLDTIFILLALMGVIVVRGLREGPRGRARLVRKVLQVGVVTAAIALPYFLWDFLTFGHLMPISGGVKSSFPVLAHSLRAIMGLGLVTGAASLAVSAVALLVLWGLERTGPRGGGGRGSVLGVLVAMWLGSVAHLLHTVLFMRWGAFWWHYASYGPVTVVLIALAVAALAARFGRLRFLPAVALTLLAVAVGTGLVWDARMRGKEHRSWYEAALWARDHLPPGTVIAMRECGLFGYFCGHPTVNLDGIINGYRYQEALRDHTLARYLAECKVTHIADFRTLYRDDRFVIPLPAFLYRAQGGALVTQRSGEVFTTETVAPVAVRTLKREHLAYALAIWDFRRVSVVEDASRLP